MDKYTINAQYIPSFILMIPIALTLVVLNINFLEISNAINMLNYEIYGVSLTANLVLWILLSKVIRYFGKHLEVAHLELIKE